MPPCEAPRGQKRAASAAWLVWWPASDKRATAKARRRLVEKAPSKRGCAVSVLDKGRSSCLLHFGAPRKYGAVLRWLTRTAECQSDFVRIARTSDVVKEPDDEGKAGPEEADAASEDAGTPGAEAKELPEPTQIQTAPAGQSAGEDQHEGAASQPSALILALKLAYSRHEAPEVIADLKLGAVLGTGGYSTVHRARSELVSSQTAPACSRCEADAASAGSTRRASEAVRRLRLDLGPSPPLALWDPAEPLEPPPTPLGPTSASGHRNGPMERRAMICQCPRGCTRQLAWDDVAGVCDFCFGETDPQPACDCDESCPCRRFDPPDTDSDSSSWRQGVSRRRRFLRALAAEQESAKPACETGGGVSDESVRRG